MSDVANHTHLPKPRKPINDSFQTHRIPFVGLPGSLLTHRPLNMIACLQFFLSSHLEGHVLASLAIRLFFVDRLPAKCFG